MELKPIIIDTNAYAAFKRGVPSAVELVKHVSRIGISAVVLGELLSGFRFGRREQQNREELSAFLRSSRVQILVIDAETAEHYATIYQHLKQKGNPIPTNDMWIAATAIQYDYGVFSYDRHYDAVENHIVGTHLDAFLE